MNMSSEGEMSEATERSTTEKDTDGRESDATQMEVTEENGLTSCSSLEADGLVHFGAWLSEYQRKMKARFQITELKLEARGMA
jgi:hypothetical protein